MREGTVEPARHPSPLLTDLYQLTMAQAYHKAGIADTEACFHLSFRENPFGGGFSVACGLAQAVEFLAGFRFEAHDIEYLATLTGADGSRLFDEEFLAWLAELRFDCDVDAVAEGTVVFPREPLLRVRGRLPLCQIVETPLLNMINFSTLIATKAARCRISAEGDPVLEFGLRRAQGPDGGLAASRAAYVGGCAATSNTLAGQRYGIPVAGTHAHSWVMAFDDEQTAFDAYADALPNNVILLVDTFDTLEGVHKAVRTGMRLRERGHDLLGIRIDSGDLAWLSRRAREILDHSGFATTRIYASNDLDEYLIASLKDQGAAIDAWGVGTKLAVGWDQPALGGVYKLSAIRPAGESRWTPRIKLSEATSKITTPGVLGVRRYRTADGVLAGDMIHDESHPPGADVVIVDPLDPTRRKAFDATMTFEDLLQPVFRGGEQVGGAADARAARERAVAGVDELDASVKRFLNPHQHPVGLERSLYDLRTALVLKSRGLRPEDAIPSAEALAEAEAAG